MKSESFSRDREMDPWGLIDPTSEDEAEALEELPELELPDFEEILQTDISNIENVKRREGNERISKPILGKLAKARLIVKRAQQLQAGAPPAISRERLRSGELQKIAEQELEERVLPIKIIRRFADGYYEIWPLSDFKYIAK